jgi:hypothetical protein
MVSPIPLTFHNCSAEDARGNACDSCVILPLPHVVRVDIDGTQYRATWPLRGRFTLNGHGPTIEEACAELVRKLDEQAAEGTDIGQAWMEARR